jgi:D-alanine-D-alanine ligase-like ATP-grasp enzyme
MTETSLLPKIAKLAGLEFADLIEEILKSSLEH